MKRTCALLAALVIVAAIGPAGAVSDGHYDPSKMHCTGSADNADNPVAQEGCYTLIVTLADGSGHEYVGAGIRQTADGDFADTLDVWIDPGQGTKTTFTFGPDGPSAPAASAGSLADPTSGLTLYFGADDNLDVGEHDSSDQINNGPSDGGGIQISTDPATVEAWVAMLAQMEPSSILTSPLPLADGGTGFCADGLCASVASVRRIAIQGTAATERDVANYSGKAWDPASCDGGSDGPSACGGVPLSTWFNMEGKVYVEPGIQIFEDPDPQASPLGGIYPIPALYIGTCGVIFGGGPDGSPFRFDGAPMANDAGQIVIPTAC